MYILAEHPAFTSIEWEIIDHRLNVPECIVECLPQYAPEDVDAVIGALLDRDWRAAYEHNDAITVAVLEDTINGSTFFGSIEDAVAVGDITNRKLKAYYRAAERITDKFEKAYGKRITLPLC